MSIPPHSPYSFPDFSDLARSLMLLKNKLDCQIQDFEKDAQEIRQYYSPRAKFDRWKSTEDGKLWKEKQHQRQKGRCADDNCGCIIEIKGSHIDHIQPISKFPDLAVDVKNLRLLCPDCNVRKGNKFENSTHGNQPDLLM